MDPERLSDYLQSLQQPFSPFLEALYERARERQIPVVRRETAGLLKTMIQLKKPGRILEIGTAVGFSALLMAEEMPEEASLITLEKSEERCREAEENIRAAGMDGRITLISGDAADILPALAPSFDLIFLDAAKGQYLQLLPELLRLLAPGGVLLSDNMLQEGDVLESRFAVRRRDRTIHARMREYTRTCMNLEELSSTLLPIGDGVMLSVRKTV